MDEVTKRAMAAYFRSDAIRGEGDQPSADSGPATYAGKEYVVLRNNTYGPLAIYRVRPTGMLKRLKKWPAELETGRAG